MTPLKSSATRVYIRYCLFQLYHGLHLALVACCRFVFALEWAQASVFCFFDSWFSHFYLLVFIFHYLLQCLSMNTIRICSCGCSCYRLRCIFTTGRFSLINSFYSRWSTILSMCTILHYVQLSVWSLRLSSTVIPCRLGVSLALRIQPDLGRIFIGPDYWINRISQ